MNALADGFPLESVGELVFWGRAMLLFGRRWVAGRLEIVFHQHSKRTFKQAARHGGRVNIRVQFTGS
jgi:hypothetical protein